MTKRPRLLCDVDEVLADFQGPALDVMARLTGRRYEASDFDVWDIFTILTPEQKALLFDVIEKPGWCASLPPLPGAIEAMKKLREFADVYPVTSPFHSLPWMVERTAWLEKHFGWTKHEVVFTGSKFLVAGDALLDDKPDHILAWQEHHPRGVAMLWHTPNTRNLLDDSYRVHTWAEVIARVRGLGRQT